MVESIIASVVFWASFVFSIGPFWAAVMATAKTMTFKEIYKNYSLFQIFGGMPQTLLIVFLVNIVGIWNKDIFIILYFVGALFIFYFAYKNFHATLAKKTFHFNWKAMVLLGWSNPKFWTTVPVGSLSANYSASLPINMVVFYLISLPLFYFGVFFWGTIGKQGSKISPKKFGYFTAFLLVSFGVYLIIEGLQAANWIK